MSGNPTRKVAEEDAPAAVAADEAEAAADADADE
jgi:hypothetical protein